MGYLRESQRFEKQGRARGRVNNKIHLQEATPSRLGTWLFYLTHRNQHRKMMKQRNMSQTNKENERKPQSWRGGFNENCQRDAH